MAIATRPESRLTGSPPAGFVARYVNLVAGCWLALSAFLWSRPNGSQLNALIIGAAIALVAFWGVREGVMRHANTVLSAWLFLSAIAVFPASKPARANDAVVAILVFVLSLIPTVAGKGRAPPTGVEPGAP